MEDEIVPQCFHVHLHCFFFFDPFSVNPNGGQQFSTIQIDLQYSGEDFWSILALWVPW